MTSGDKHKRPKHRSLRLTHEPHSRFIRRLATALFTMVAIGLLALMAYLITHPKAPEERGPYQKAHELDALIHRDARFAEVKAWCWYPGLEIHDFKPLSAEAKADLERLVNQYAQQNHISVRYFSDESNSDHTGEQQQNTTDENRNPKRRGGI